ncbi:MAG TPA: trypsin-like peptidase domain-containing protein [Candidatus Paceibacterota bacterium]|nr:trypsin-like peptidase domain-containing protein [Candidatus Paceibacterota bacterium]
MDNRHIHKKMVIVAACSALAVVIILFGIIYAFRTKIFSSIARDYVNANSENDSTVAKTALFSDDSIITNAVQKTNPAVVSITISKDVPKYETLNNIDPFGFFFQTPFQNGTENREIGNGSGFLVSNDGYIVTNRHVVEDEDASYTVTLNDSKKYPAKIIAVDQVYDVAIIKIEGNSFPFIALGDSSRLQLGSTVIAIGNALGQFKNTVSVGVVSGLSRSIRAGDGMGNSEQLDQVIQTDAAINPGNSGGPLLDLNGQVVGINVAVAQGSQSIGFALPINSVKGIIASVKATGKIIRPYLGVRYIQIDEAFAEKEKLSVSSGVLIRSDNSGAAILKGSPAEKAGLKEGDIIIEADGKKLDETQSLALIVREHQVGDTLTLKILRAGANKTIIVTLQEAPQS